MTGKMLLMAIIVGALDTVVTFQFIGQNRAQQE
jgi:hypothetical protein